MSSNKIQSFDATVRTAMAGVCGVKPHSRVLVAVSGGADSVALLASLTAAGYECIAAHCNFHLRGAESQRDMHHVQDVSRQLDVDLHIKHFDVATERKRTGESVEMACRRLRYSWFHDLLELHRAVAIAVAHHRDDQAETFLLNTLRGTGIAGLGGMAARNGLVVRPMLGLSRADVEDYLRARGLTFVVDSTNLENDFKRNKIRNLILPALNDAFPGAADAIVRTTENVRGNLGLYRWAVEQVRKNYLDARTLNVAAIVGEMPREAAAMALFEVVREYGFSSTQAANILASAMSTETVKFETATGCAELKDGLLHLDVTGQETASDETVKVTLRTPIMSPVRIDITEHDISEFAPERNPKVMYMDVEMLAGNPTFEIRPWRRGDKMRPFGMTGAKLLSDLYTDARYTLEQKRRAKVLTRNGAILWAIGLRASALYTVTPSTRRYLRLELL